MTVTNFEDASDNDLQDYRDRLIKARIEIIHLLNEDRIRQSFVGGLDLPIEPLTPKEIVCLNQVIGEMDTAIKTAETILKERRID